MANTEWFYLYQIPERVRLLETEMEKTQMKNVIKIWGEEHEIAKKIKIQ